MKLNTATLIALGAASIAQAAPMWNGEKIMRDAFESASSTGHGVEDTRAQPLGDALASETIAGSKTKRKAPVKAAAFTDEELQYNLDRQVELQLAPVGRQNDIYRQQQFDAQKQTTFKIQRKKDLRSKGDSAANPVLIGSPERQPINDFDLNLVPSNDP